MTKIVHHVTRLYNGSFDDPFPQAYPSYEDAPQDKLGHIFKYHNHSNTVSEISIVVDQRFGKEGDQICYDYVLQDIFDPNFTLLD